MDPLQIPSSSNEGLPQIMQVFQPPDMKVQNSQIIQITHPTLQTIQDSIPYQPTMTADSLQLPLTSQITHELQTQQILSTQDQMMTCQQTRLTSIHHQQVPGHALQDSDPTNNIQYSHLVVPMQMFKQDMAVDLNYQGQYNEFLNVKNDSAVAIVTKIEVLEPIDIVNHANIEKFDENKQNKEDIKEEIPKKLKTKKTKRHRNAPNPSEWACNQRKLKHQRGEAYVNRRGKYVPEKNLKNNKNCADSCKYKCRTKIPDEDRETILKQFYSLNVNEKKHYLLSTTERNNVRSNRNTTRKYAYKYFFVIRSTKIVVCKNFYLGTLAISQKPIYNVHKDKSDVNLPKPDGRGKSEASSHAFPNDIKNRVRQHIMSFKTIKSKPVVEFSRKRQYLENKLNIKKMYMMYCKECEEENTSPVKESMYRKIFKNDFNLHFKKQLCCKCKGSLKGN